MKIDLRQRRHALALDQHRNFARTAAMLGQEAGLLRFGAVPSPADRSVGTA
jgi:hypothetical protein